MNYDEFVEGANRVCLDALRLADAQIPLAETADIPLSLLKDHSMSELAIMAYSEGIARQAIRTVECWLLENNVHDFLEDIFTDTRKLHPLATVSVIYLMLDEDIVATYLYRAVAHQVANRFSVREGGSWYGEYEDVGQQAILEIYEGFNKNFFFMRRVRWASHKIEPVLRKVIGCRIINYLKKMRPKGIYTASTSVLTREDRDFVEGVLEDTHVEIDLEKVAEEVPLSAQEVEKLGLRYRQKEILMERFRNSKITNVNLAERFNVSTKTIQRDMRDIESTVESLQERGEVQPFLKPLIRQLRKKGLKKG